MSYIGWQYVAMTMEKFSVSFFELMNVETRGKHT